MSGLDRVLRFLTDPDVCPLDERLKATAEQVCRWIAPRMPEASRVAVFGNAGEDEDGEEIEIIAIDDTEVAAYLDVTIRADNWDAYATNQSATRVVRTGIVRRPVTEDDIARLMQQQPLVDAA